jgi:hypothetical protein
MHLTERSGGDFGLVYRYYLSLEQELAAGKASWRDSIGRRSLNHFETVFFKIGIHVASFIFLFHILVFIPEMHYCFSVSKICVEPN